MGLGKRGSVENYRQNWVEIGIFYKPPIILQGSIFVGGKKDGDSVVR